MSTDRGPAEVVELPGVVAPSRWWGLVDAAAEVLPGGAAGGWTYDFRATSDDGEELTADRVEAARRAVAGWDGDLEVLSVSCSRSAGSPDDTRVHWALARGAAPRVEVSGSDQGQVSSLASALRDRLSPLVSDLAEQDARPVPPGRAGRIWPKLDALGVGIAVGISVVVVLAVAGSVWAWVSSR